MRTLWIALVGAAVMISLGYAQALPSFHRRSRDWKRLPPPEAVAATMIVAQPFSAAYQLFQAHPALYWADIAALPEWDEGRNCFGDLHPDHFDFVAKTALVRTYEYTGGKAKVPLPVAADVLRYFTAVHLREQDTPLLECLVNFFVGVLEGKPGTDLPRSYGSCRNFLVRKGEAGALEFYSTSGSGNSRTVVRKQRLEIYKAQMTLIAGKHAKTLDQTEDLKGWLKSGAQFFAQRYRAIYRKTLKREYTPMR